MPGEWLDGYVFTPFLDVRPRRQALLRDGETC